MAAEEKKANDDCFDPQKPKLLHREVIDKLKSVISPVTATETIPLEDALGRITAGPVKSPLTVPPLDNSAVDGYGFDSDSFSETGGWYPVVARIPAGHPSNLIINPGAAVRIFTGAVIPAGVDTVAMQEDCEPHEQDGEQFVAIPQGLKPGANVRRAGEDIMTGAPAFSDGHRLRPQDIARLASLGLESVSVHSRLKVAILSTGDEIRPPGEPLGPGEIHNSNTPLLTALLDALPVDITESLHLPDNAALIEETVARLARENDLVLTSGGASLGEEDHITATLGRLGTRHAWQLAIKPGRPMLFGQIRETPFMGLPGNPVAVMVCFLLYVYPAIFVLSGGAWPEPHRFRIPAAFDMKKKPGRREFLRGILEYRDTGPVLRKYDRDGSGLIQGLIEADGLIELSEEATSVKPDDMVTFIPFSSFGICHS